MDYESKPSLNTEAESRIRKIISKAKPIAKRIARGATVVGVSLTLNSLSAVASETYNKASSIAKTAKSAKSATKTAKRAAEIGSTLFVCTNAGVGAEDIINNKVSKPFMVLVLGMIWVCGFMYCENICGED
jgi:hypothetical protein